MTKTPTTPSTMWPTLQRWLDERVRYAYLHGSKPKVSQLTGTPKTASELYVDARKSAAVYEDRGYWMDNEEQHYRDFAEKFVLARCKDFTKQSDGFDAVCDAKAVFKMIQATAGSFRDTTGPTGARVGLSNSDLQAAFEMGRKHGMASLGAIGGPLPDAAVQGALGHPQSSWQENLARAQRKMKP